LNAGAGVRAMVIAMTLSGRERRILAEIEQALEREDPELAQRVAAINKIESDGNSQACGERLRMWALAHVWVIFSVGGVLIVLLLLAVLTT
jgi:ribose 1,5-bisphosphokinase PhnN